MNRYRSEPALTDVGREALRQARQRTTEIAEGAIDDLHRPRRDERPTADQARRAGRLHPLMSALASREALRQAILVSEILGPPKGTRRDG